MSEQQQMTRVMGRWDVLAVAFGSMIGFGWIVLTGDFLESAGTLGAALAFVVGGTVMLLVGLTYAELVSAMPNVGGEHNYALRALGSRPAFVVSWLLILGYVSVVAFEAVALPHTVTFLFPDMPVGYLWTIAEYDVYATWVAVGIGCAIFITVINIIGVRPAAFFQTAAVIFLLAVGATMIFGSFVGGSVENMDPLITGGLGGFLVVLVATPFLFVGFDVIPQSAEEINLPFRRIGQLLLLSVLLAVIWYIMVMVTVGSALPAAELAASDLAAADGVSALWNSELMGQVIVLGGIAGLITSWNGFMIGASRLVFALARSGMLPKWFGQLHPRFKTPANAVLFIGGLSVFAPFFGRPALVWFVNAGSLAIVSAFCIVAICFLVLRRKEPNMERPFRTPAGTVVGWLAVILSLALAVLYMPGMSAALAWPEEWLIVGGWLLLGVFFLVKVPSITPGPDAEHRLLMATGRISESADAGAAATEAEPPRVS